VVLRVVEVEEVHPFTVPTLTAATLPTRRRSIPYVRRAAASATYPPVMLAVRRAAVRLEHVAVDR